MKKAGEILVQVLSDLHAEGKQYVSFYNSWEKIAGTDIANHSELSDIKNGILYIEVDHPGWIQLIQMKKKHITGKIRSMFPELEVRDIRIFLGKFSAESEKNPHDSVKNGKEEEEELDFKGLLEKLRRNIVKDD